MKGVDILAKHFPELNSFFGRMKIALLLFGWLALATCYFILTDNIPTWSIDSQIIVIALGFLIISFFFSRKKMYKERYGELAYRNAFVHYAIPGISLIFSAIAHAAYMNGPAIPNGWWTTVFIVLGWLSIVSGAVLWMRSVFAFGADNLALLYVYHPEEGRVVDSSIYGILRHPVYAGVMRVMIGFAFLNGNANSIASALFVPLGLTGWVRLVEEKELIERFGQTYLDYHGRVPAFFPKLRSLGGYVRFLFLGN